MTEFFDESTLTPPVLKDQPKPAPPSPTNDNNNGKRNSKNNNTSNKATSNKHGAPSPYTQPPVGAGVSPSSKKKNPGLTKDSVRSLNALETHENRREKSMKSSPLRHGQSQRGESSPTGGLALETAQELQAESDEINDLVEAQRSAAAEGRFLDAHYYQKRLKDAAKSHQQHVDNDLHFSKMNAILSSREVTHSHKEKMMIFTTEWEKQLGELERKATIERNNLAQRHQRELAEQEEIIRGQIALRWQNVKSKALTDAHQTTQRLASQQFYYYYQYEAHQAQLYAEKLEAKEQAEKEAKFQRELTRRMNALKSAKAKEMAALESRIDSAREALLTQRARDYEVLVLKQYNKQVTDEQKVRVEFGKKRTEVQRKMVGVQTRLGKKAQSATLPPLSGSSTMNSQQASVYRSTLSKSVNHNNNSSSRTGTRSGSATGNKNTTSNSALEGSTTSNVVSTNNTGAGVLNTVGISYEGKDELPLPITSNTTNTTNNRPSSGSQHIPRPPSGSRN